LKIFSDNFINYPIIDIQDYNGICPKGWESFLTDKWPGYVNGCDCTDSWDIIYSKDFVRGICDFNQTIANCKNIPFHEGIPFTTYREKKLCKKRGNENFLDLYKKRKISKDSYCSLGMKLCGKLDTTGNYLCVNGKENCPINDIKILNYNDYPPKEKEYKCLNLGNGKILYFSNINGTKDDFIYTNIKLSEGLRCLNSQQVNTKNKY